MSCYKCSKFKFYFSNKARVAMQPLACRGAKPPEPPRPAPPTTTPQYTYRKRLLPPRNIPTANTYYHPTIYLLQMATIATQYTYRMHLLPHRNILTANAFCNHIVLFFQIYLIYLSSFVYIIYKLLKY